jgi:tetratricopeptide (TPR) repeat protein
VAWVAHDTSTNQPCILREYVGADPAAKRRFTQLARTLLQLPELVVPPLYPFTADDRCWLVEDRVSRTTLADVASQPPPPGERQCNEILSQLLSALSALHQHQPLFDGNVRPETVVREGDVVRFMHLGCLDPSAPPVDTGIARDIYGAGATIAQVLCGSVGEALPNWQKRISEIEDLPFAATMQWMLTDSAKRPASIAAVLAFRELVQRAQTARSSNLGEARRLLDEAYNLSGVQKISAALDELKAKTAKAVPSAPKAESPKESPPAPSVPPAPRLAAQPPTSVQPTGAETSAVQVPAVSHAPDGVAGPAKTASVVEPPPAPQPPTPAPPAKSSKAGLKWTIVAAASLGVLLYLIFGNDSFKRDFDAQMTAGNVASTNGRSAYAIYLEAVQNKGVASSAVQYMNQKALPILDQRSRDTLQSWYTRGEVGNTTWDELARIEDWRFRITNSNEAHAAHEYAAGMSAFTQKHFAEARQLFNTALGYQPDWVLALNAMGRACYNLRDFGCAEQYYRRAANADARWYYPRINLANLYANNFHNFPAAETAYREAIGLDGTRGTFHFEYASLLYALGKPRWSDACVEYRAAMNGVNSPLQPSQINVARQRVQKVCQ